MVNIKKLVGQRIRALRVAEGFESAESLAENLGVSTNTIYELERGENWISAETLEKLSVLFGESPGVFFDTPPKVAAIKHLSPEALSELEVVERSPNSMALLEEAVRAVNAHPQALGKFLNNLMPHTFERKSKSASYELRVTEPGSPVGTSTAIAEALASTLNDTEFENIATYIESVTNGRIRPSLARKSSKLTRDGR